jgi:hydrogenase maturation protease
MSTIVIGLGNPVLTDDSVGMHAVREISARLQGQTDVVVRELCSGGLDLMEAMVGYECAIVVDAAFTGQMDPGTVFATNPASLCRSRNTTSNHNASLEIALELGALAGLPLPHKIRLWAVEASDVTTFGESLTEPVQRALPILVGSILRDIQEGAIASPEKSV